MVFDVSCAFVYTKIKRTVYIELPVEDPRSTDGSQVGKLMRALYGARDAPQAWFEELSGTLGGIGFTQSKRFPGIFWHREWEVALVAHVDDLL